MSVLTVCLLAQKTKEKKRNRSPNEMPADAGHTMYKQGSRRVGEGGRVAEGTAGTAGPTALSFVMLNFN